MAIRYSDAAVAKLAGNVGLRRLLNGSYMTFFTGSQPSSANDAIGSAQPIISFTLNGSAYTPETSTEWGFTLSAILGEVSITSVSVGGIELVDETITESSIDNLCAEITSSINQSANNLGFYAENNSPSVKIIAPEGVGTRLNALSLAVADGGNITIAYDDTGHTGATVLDGAYSVAGLSFDYPVDGSLLSPAESVFYIGKPTASVWGGLNGFDKSGSVFAGITSETSYTAGWGRICSDLGDTGIDATSGSDGYIRCDFSVGASSADCTMLPNSSFLVDTASSSEIQSLINTFRLKINKNMT